MPRTGRPNTLSPAWAAMVEAAGSVNELAEMLGVTPMTIWRWDKTPPDRLPTRIAIASVAKKLRVPSPVDPE